jgi:hypothetical protein
MLHREKVTARGRFGRLETKLRVRDTDTNEVYFEDIERKHAFTAMNPAVEGRLRRHVNNATAANDRGDTAAVRRALAAMQTFLDGLLGIDRDGDDDQDQDETADDDESKTPPSRPRRARGNQPTIDQPWPAGESTEHLMASQHDTYLRQIRQLRAYHARYPG